MYRRLKYFYIWIKHLYMYSIVAFLEARIDALTTNKSKLEKKITKLETIIFELCDKDCTDEYKELVKHQVFNDDDEN